MIKIVLLCVSNIYNSISGKLPLMKMRQFRIVVNAFAFISLPVLNIQLTDNTFQSINNSFFLYSMIYEHIHSKAFFYNTDE